ncbi:hypothetical protein N7474_000728 [Penicillium riverlandense]|uniref:uncharacterized protein n=1 Tax=Penicillium riverlandense TaxID=1903569 RepID=UPI002546D906|nr:uncharacterized protein N7474_000728 [Penicillium riverlandense]KAJ5832417.1 hypothetical protein N7474_000728 [Penicillium riverlandense]
METSRSTHCSQGRISLFSAEVQTTQHIQAAVKFAAQHNLKLAIKNTGHDFLGRSSAPHSLQILTNQLRNISVYDSFVPSVPSHIRAPKGAKAVTLGAGVQLREMYEYLGTQGLMVVGGSSNTVGAAGGYIQGGGHSIMGWLHGMASDNALEFQVVIADGTLVFANAYQNTDLFFALRGGGGGSFGVVVSVTVNAYPDYPVLFTSTNYTLSKANGPFWNGVQAFHNHLVELNDHGGSGYYLMAPQSPVTESQTEASAVLFMFFVNQTDMSVVDPLFSPLISDLTNVTGIEPSYNTYAFPSMSNMYTTILTGNDTTGTMIRFGSQLVSRSLFETGSSQRLTNAMERLGMGSGEYLLGVALAGGKVAENRVMETALNPAWRETLVHMVFMRTLSPNMSFAEQEAIAANVTDGVSHLKAVESGRMGAYLNEADADEPNFQQSFWGSNYPRLRAIKAERDPRDLFIVRKGVGSENWDDSGLCRIH